MILLSLADHEAMIRIGVRVTTLATEPGCTRRTTLQMADMR
ncbi:MAG: hypothetical protein K0R13_2881 [Propionibacteriaceae bacterium]|nr:hypothetical protein [Propionibacteriaceae bacterium]